MSPTGTFADECKLVAGYEEEPPFHSMSPTGEVRGIDADILSAVADDLGCQLKFVKSPWPRTLAEVKRGRMSIAIGARYTDERAEFAFYSPAYKIQKHYLISVDQSVCSGAGLETFLERRNLIAVPRGWYYPTEVRSVLDNRKYRELIINVDDFQSSIDMLHAGRVQGIVGNVETARQMMQRKGGDTADRLCATSAGAEPLHYLLSKIAVGDELSKKFGKALRRFKSSPEYPEIFVSYIGDKTLMVDEAN